MSDPITRTPDVVVDGCAPLLSKPGAWEGFLAGGVDLALPTVATHEGPEEAIPRVRQWREWIDGEARLKLVASRDDLGTLGDSRLGIGFHFQNTTPLGDDLGSVAEYHRLGVRMIQLTYNHRNLVGGGCLDSEDRGLTGFGRDLIGEMNQLGVVVDLSHTGLRTTLEAIEASSHPVVFSHSNAVALFDHPRNISDEQIRAVAVRGGLVGVNAVSSFLRTDGVGACRGDLMSHLDYLAEMIGPSQVCLGLDFWWDAPLDYSEWTTSGRWTSDDLNKLVTWPEGICGPGHIPRIARELAARGYAAEEVAGIMGNNWVRLFGEVWR